MNKSAQRTLPRLDESLLAHLPPFSKLERRDIRVILDQASSQRYGAGVVIFDEGAPAERFYMLLDGYVRVIRVTATGEQVTALHIPAGQLLGIAKAIGRDTYPATAMTATEALALSWPARLWDTYVAQYDGFATETYKTQTGRKVPGGIEIDFPITRQDLSELTATTLHTVSRLLSAWEKKGMVQSKRKRITVCDPHALVVLSQA